MKPLYTLLIIGASVLGNNTLNAQEKVYKIDYEMMSAPEDKKKKKSKEPSETLMTSYIGKNYFKNITDFILSTKTIVDANKSEEYELVDVDSIYYTSSFSNFNYPYIRKDTVIEFADQTVGFIYKDEATKVIAGITCKSVDLQLKIEGISDSEIPLIKVWYAPDIPRYYWSKYQYLQIIPGAALSIDISGFGIEATQVAQVEVDKNFFSLEGYTESEKIVTTSMDELPASYSNEEVNEKYIDYDSATTYFAIKNTPKDKPKFIYNYVFGMQNGNFLVSDLKEKWTVLDKNLKPIMPFVFDDAAYNDYEYVILSKDEKFGVYDLNLKPIFPHTAGYIHSLNEKYFVGNFGTDYLENNIYDLKGNPILKENTKKDISISDDYLILTDSELNQSQLFNINTKSYIVGTYENIYARDYTNVPFLVMKDDKYGFIDASGKVIIPIIYTSALNFDEEGITTVYTKNNKEIRLNTKGEKVK